VTALTSTQKRHLRALAHHRKVLVIIGAAGVTDALTDELDAALAHHELVKVRVNAPDRAARENMIDTLLERTGAVLVQTIGHIATLYRPAEQPTIKLPR
jgi:RNA-binding protein